MTTISASPAVFEARSVRKTYPGVTALANASLSLAPGEIVGLIGKNGAGKSTLIKVMAGVVTPDSGQIAVNGQEVSLVSPDDARAAGLSFVHQELALVPQMTVAENVFLGSGYPTRAGLVREKELDERCQALLTSNGIDLDPAAVVAGLTPVRQRLVMIARGLAANALVLVLDEPSTSLPEHEVALLHRVVRGLASTGVAIVYVSHRLQEIMSLTDRVVVMRDGLTVADGRTQDLTRPQLVEMMTGEAVPDRPRVHESFRGDGAVLKVEGLRSPDLAGEISFTVGRGEILGIAGLVGSGRSELLMALFGATRGTEAEIEVNGASRTIRHPRDAIKAGIVLLPEDRRGQGLFLGMDVLENLTISSLWRHRTWPLLPLPSHTREAATGRRLVQDLHIKTSSLSTLARNLSGGNQQKLMLGKWLAGDSQVLMFDEPTQGIDIHAKQEAFDAIRRLAKEGRGIILVSSDFAEIVDNCDRAIVLREGRLVGELSGSELVERALVEACYRD